MRKNFRDCTLADVLRLPDDAIDLDVDDVWTEVERQAAGRAAPANDAEGYEGGAPDQRGDRGDGERTSTEVPAEAAALVVPENGDWHMERPVRRPRLFAFAAAAALLLGAGYRVGAGVAARGVERQVAEARSEQRRSDEESFKHRAGVPGLAEQDLALAGQRELDEQRAQLEAEEARVAAMKAKSDEKAGRLGQQVAALEKQLVALRAERDALKESNFAFAAVADTKGSEQQALEQHVANLQSDLVKAQHQVAVQTALVQRLMLERRTFAKAAEEAARHGTAGAIVAPNVGVPAPPAPPEPPPSPSEPTEEWSPRRATPLR
jgi:hypothetical protein